MATDAALLSAGAAGVVARVGTGEVRIADAHGEDDEGAGGARMDKDVEDRGGVGAGEVRAGTVCVAVDCTYDGYISESDTTAGSGSAT